MITASIALLLLLVLAAILTIRKGKRITIQTTFTRLNLNFIIMVHAIGQPVLFNVFMWSISLLFVIGHPDGSYAGYQYNSPGLIQYVILAVVLLVLSIIFLLVNLFIYRDHNPISASILNLRSMGPRIMKLVLKILLVLELMVIKAPNSKYIIWVSTLLVYSYTMYYNAIRVEFFGIYVQVVNCVYDAAILTVTLLALLENMSQGGTNTVYELFVMLIVIFLLTSWVVKNKLRLLQSSVFEQKIGGLNKDQIYEQFLDIILVLKNLNAVSKSRLYYYLTEEIESLNDMAQVTRETHNLLNRELTYLKKLDSYRRDSTSDILAKKQLKEDLFDMYVNMALLTSKVKGLDKPSITMLIYSLLDNLKYTNICVRLYIVLLNMNTVKKSFSSNVALYCINEELAKRLESSKQTNNLYRKSEFGDFLTFDLRLKKFIDLITKSARLMKRYWLCLSPVESNVQLGLKLRSEIYDINEKISSYYTTMSKFTIYKRRVDIVYIRYLRTVLSSKEKALKIEHSGKLKNSALEADIRDLSSSVYLLSNTTKKYFVTLSIDQSSFGHVIKNSTELGSFLGWPNKSFKDRSFFDFLVPHTYTTLIANIKKTHESYKPVKSAINADNLLMFLDADRYLKFAMFDLHIMLDSDNGISVLVVIWPLKLSPWDQNMMLLYDKATYRIKYICKSVSQHIDIRPVDLDEDESRAGSAFMISNIWPDINKPDVMKKFKEGGMVTAKMTNPQINVDSKFYENNESGNMRDRRNEPSLVITDTNIQNIEMNVDEQCELELMRVSLRNTKPANTNTNKGTTITSNMGVDSSMSLHTDVEAISDKFFENVSKFKRNYISLYIHFLKALFVACMIVLLVLISLNYVRFKHGLESNTDNLDYIDIVVSRVEGVTSCLYYMLQLVKAESGVIKWTGDLLTPKNILSLFSAYQINETKRQTKQVQLLLKRESRINLYLIVHGGYAETEGVVSGDNGERASAYFTKDNYQEDSYYNVMYFYNMGMDNFVSNRNIDQYYMSKHTWISLSASLLAKYQNLKLDIESDIKKQSKTYLRYILAIYLCSIVSVIGIVGAVYRALGRVIMLYSTMMVLNKDQVGKYINRIDSGIDKKSYQTASDDFKGAYGVNIYEPNIETSSRPHADSLGVPDSSIDNNTRRVIVKRFGCSYTSSVRRVLWLPVVCVLTCASSYMYQRISAIYMYDKISLKYELLNSLSELKMNLIRLNYSYFSVFFDEQCTDECITTAGELNSAVYENITAMNDLFIKVAKEFKGEYFDQIKSISTNLCAYYFEGIVKNTAKCTEYEIFYTGIATILYNALNRYRSIVGLANDPNIDKIHTTNAYQVYYARQGIVNLLAQGIAEEVRHSKSQSIVQMVITIVTFAVLLIVGALVLYCSVRYLKRQVNETTLFVNLLNTDIAMEAEDSQSFLNEHKF